MKCKICEVESPQDLCVACSADKAFIDSKNDKSGKPCGGSLGKTGVIDHKQTVKRLMNMPDHLFFYGLKYLLFCKDKSGEIFNDYLLRTDRRNSDPVWERLKGYRGGRRHSTAFGDCDRWDTNPLLPKYG